MVTMIIRGLSAKTHQALKARAMENGGGMATEIRAILEDAVRPPERIKMGSEWAAIGRELDLVDFHPVREPDLPDPATFV